MEIKTANFQIGPIKAPSMDRHVAIFYQNFWSIVGPKVTKIVLYVLNNNGNFKAINYTYIILIPKVKEPENMAQFRPISLCNVL